MCYVGTNNKTCLKKLPNQINCISYSNFSTSKRKKGYIRHLAHRHADFYAVSQVSAKGAIITNARASGRSLLVDCDKSARMVLKRVSSSCDIRNKCVPISMQAYNSVCPGQYYQCQQLWYMQVIAQTVATYFTTILLGEMLSMCAVVGTQVEFHCTGAMIIWYIGHHRYI